MTGRAAFVEAGSVVGGRKAGNIHLFEIALPSPIHKRTVAATSFF
jgi:hypothetical protein